MLFACFVDFILFSLFALVGCFLCFPIFLSIIFSDLKSLLLTWSQIIFITWFSGGFLWHNDVIQENSSWVALEQQIRSEMMPKALSLQSQLHVFWAHLAGYPRIRGTWAANRCQSCAESVLDTVSATTVEVLNWCMHGFLYLEYTGLHCIPKDALKCVLVLNRKVLGLLLIAYSSKYVLK